MRVLLVGMLLLAFFGHGVTEAQTTPQDSSKYFTITVLDDRTDRGVPLVELTTSSQQRFYTDSHGIIALDEPSLMNKVVAFSIFSHGYKSVEYVLLTPKPGGESVVKVKRLNVAERLYRITGQDIYGASVRLGRPAPIQHQQLNGGVTGQDTFIETLYKGKLYWFWGDTGGLSQFNGKASGATSELPGQGGLDPSAGIDLTYFVDSVGFTKPICPFGGPTLVWITWLATAADSAGVERLYTLYKCIESNGKPGESGFATFNDSAQQFEPLNVIAEWYGLSHRIGHPARVQAGGREYLYIMNYDGLERVESDPAHFTDPARYERFTCLSPGAPFDSASSHLDRDSSGTLIYGWKPNTAAVNHRRQGHLVQSGVMTGKEGLWQFEDMESGNPVSVDPASVFWNTYRQRWVMMAYEFTGGVWFFEGDTPTGPWVYGRKIVAHKNYDFYNVSQHPLFDQEDGRFIYFEGTYTTGFSGNKCATPLYDYNQMMYRLDLDDDRLSLPDPVYCLTDGQYLMREALDSSNLWNRIERIPFFAVPPKSRNGELIPVFVERSQSAPRFTTSPPASGPQGPLFFALPLVPHEASRSDPVTGSWKCKAKMPGFSDVDFEFDLQRRGKDVTGTYVTKGVFSGDTLDLALQILDYTLKGELTGGVLVGEFQKVDGTISGSWSGERVVEMAMKESPSVVFLYEYRTSEGRYAYSVDSTLATEGWQRTTQPICRVWRNPSSVIALDYTAKPISP